MKILLSWAVDHLLPFLRLSLVVFGVLAFVAGLISGTPENPPGELGLYAALTALCTASLALALGRLIDRPIWRAAIWLGAAATAYLWMVAESNVNPLGAAMPLLVLALFGITASLTLVAFSALIFPGRDPNSEGSRQTGETSHDDDRADDV